MTPRSLAAWTWLPEVSARGADDELALGGGEEFELLVLAREVEEDFDGVAERGLAGLGAAGRGGIRRRTWAHPSSR